MTHVSHSLRRVKLSANGYDASGAYWGAGLPLYELQFKADGTTNTATTFFRAASRDLAVLESKRIVASVYGVKVTDVSLWRGL